MRPPCSKCGAQKAQGEPALCQPCFIEEFRKDPAWETSPLNPDREVD